MNTIIPTYHGENIGSLLHTMQEVANRSQRNIKGVHSGTTYEIGPMRETEKMYSEAELTAQKSSFIAKEQLEDYTPSETIQYPKSQMGNELSSYLRDMHYLALHRQKTVIGSFSQVEIKVEPKTNIDYLKQVEREYFKGLEEKWRGPEKKEPPAPQSKD